MQLADNNPTTPTTKNNPATIDHNPPHPVRQTNETNNEATQLTVAENEIIGKDPNRPISRVFMKLPNMIPTIFNANKNP